jgi:hypothetical protein
MRHGFLRRVDGTIEVFDLLNATNTWPVAINERRQIAGYYADVSSALHGFLREADGHVKRFDVPNSTSTVPTAMNERSEITGVFTDSDGKQHGFVTRAPRSYRDQQDF